MPAEAQLRVAAVCREYGFEMSSFPVYHLDALEYLDLEARKQVPILEARINELRQKLKNKNDVDPSLSSAMGVDSGYVNPTESESKKDGKFDPLKARDERVTALENVIEHFKKYFHFFFSSTINEDCEFCCHTRDNARAFMRESEAWRNNVTTNKDNNTDNQSPRFANDFFPIIEQQVVTSPVNINAQRLTAIPEFAQTNDLMFGQDSNPVNSQNASGFGAKRTTAIEDTKSISMNANALPFFPSSNVFSVSALQHSNTVHFQ